MAFTFTYTQQPGLASQNKVTMEFSERSSDEMCEYFQRFLTACGYYFEDGEQIQVVKKEKEIFSGFPTSYDFGDDQFSFCAAAPVVGGFGEDIIFFGDK
jgi:hypothetical protein